MMSWSIYKFSARACFLLITTQLLIICGVQAQDDGYEDHDHCLERRGLEYGAVAGIYFADKATADFYSGKPDNENSIEYIFRNQYYYKDIRDLLDVNDTVVVLEYPGKMKYIRLSHSECLQSMILIAITEFIFSFLMPV